MPALAALAVGLLVNAQTAKPVKTITPVDAKPVTVAKPSEVKQENLFAKSDVKPAKKKRKQLLP